MGSWLCGGRCEQEGWDVKRFFELVGDTRGFWRELLMTEGGDREERVVDAL